MIAGGKVKQVKFYLEEEYYEMLRRRAEQEGVSISSLVRDMVIKALTHRTDIERLERLEREVKKLKEEYKKLIEIIKAYREALIALDKCCAQINPYYVMAKASKQR